MEIITYIQNESDISSLLSANVSQAILCPSLLSKFGTLSIEKTNSLAKLLLENKITPILEWDILMTENVFSSVASGLSKIELSLFREIRLCDPGAINYILKNHPQLNIQLMLESGAYHNFTSLEVMKDLIGERLSRIILSLELSFDYLCDFVKNTNVPVEFLGLGRILLFYTPRKLITPLFGEEEKNYYEVNQIPIEVKASSEESAHKGFPVIENVHGTFMFNTKDHFVLEYLEDLKRSGLSYLRVDLRFENNLESLLKISKITQSFDEAVVKEIKESHSVSVIRGFFHTNKSDVLFKKLKNQKLKRVDDSYIGEVIDVSKGSYILVQLKSKTNSIRKGQTISLTTPEGKTKQLVINLIKNTKLIELEEAKYNDLVLLPFVSGATVRSIIHSC